MLRMNALHSAYLVWSPRTLPEHQSVLGCNSQLSMAGQRMDRVQVIAMAVKTKQKKMNFFLEDETIEDEGMADIVDMEEWMRNRPPGFGDGKVYDLSLEEKLLAEIEADRVAREAAKKGLGKGVKAKKTGKAPKLSEAPPGVEVWVGNLPRKRKVDRDLHAVFRTAPGLLHIRPIVNSENEKTRDPLCKGFAFLTFATEGDADNFVSRFHGEIVKFGKLQKKIACEVAESNSPWRPTPTIGTPATSATGVPKLRVRDKGAAMDLSFTPKPSPTYSDNVGGESKNLAGSSVDTKQNQRSLKRDSEEEGDGVEDEEVDVRESELRAMEEEIWQEFEDEDDFALDMELENEEVVEPVISQSVQDIVENSDVDDTATLEMFKKMNHSATAHDVIVKNSRSPSRESVYRSSEIDSKKTDSGEKAADKMKELEAKVREMEARLEEVAQSEEERIIMLERRVLGKAKAAVGVTAVNTRREKGNSGEKKGSKAATKSKSKSATPKLGGSSSRLKAKERNILTGVVSKYSSSTL